jgi:hypothetical protein
MEVIGEKEEVFPYIDYRICSEIFFPHCSGGMDAASILLDDFCIVDDAY